MKWKITAERARREITFELTEGEPTKIHRWAGDQGFTFLPVRAKIVVEDGRRRGLTAYGPQIKKDGTPGVNERQHTWRVSAITNEDQILSAPRWVQQLWETVADR